MAKRVQVLGYVDDISNKLEVKYEGEIIRFMTHIESRGGFMNSYEMALIQLDNGSFKAEKIENIRLKK